jgi:biopolymer transport protein ExbB
MLGQVLSTGGLILWPIAATSIAALTVVIERLWRLLPLRARFAAARSRCQDALLHGGSDLAKSRLDEGDPLSRVFLAGLEVRALGHDTVRAVALDAAQREVPGIERGLGVVLAASQVAPLLGLLGTVSGLIEAFQRASEAKVVTLTVVSDGLYKALGATVAGLLVAIPAFLAYIMLSALSARLVDQLEHAATDLPLLLRRTS